MYSRNLFFRKIWKRCRSLFSLGALERRDAYNILSLYLSFFSCTEGCGIADESVRGEEFDVRAERDFWDEMKKGLVFDLYFLPFIPPLWSESSCSESENFVSLLFCDGFCQVDGEGLVRKQSLHILKTVLQISGGTQCHYGVSEKKSRAKHSVPRVMTKREMWADKEAKSLGIGKLSNSADSPLNSQQHWEAFLLLYEMLQEYGTHLVEAAWNHQVLIQLSYTSHVIYWSFFNLLSW